MSSRITVCPPILVDVPPDGVGPGLPGGDTVGAGLVDDDPLGAGLVPPPALAFTSGENGS
jgi:hypothetical protein